MNVNEVATRERIVAAFLERYWKDQGRGEDHGLLHYAALFPSEHVDLVAAEYLAVTHALGESIERRIAEPAESRLGHYKIGREIGRGGQGTVYLAMDMRNTQQVALKVLRGIAPLQGESLDRFHREAEVAARLEHPGICGVLEAGVEDGLPYIAMRYVEGETLENKIAAARSRASTSVMLRLDEAPPRRSPGDEPDGGLQEDVRRIVELIEHAARAVHEAHRMGVVHRDIKPGNIMITGRGDPVILDFGLARDLDAEGPSLTKPGDLFGTPGYMAPEQLGGAKSLRVDRRVDVWALGVTLYESLTLRRPFETPTRQGDYEAIRLKDPEDPRHRNPAIPADLKVVMETALEKDPDRRYQTALDLAEELGRVREGEPIAARSMGPVGRTWRWAKRRRARAALVALLVVAIPTVATLGGVLWAKLPDIRERERQRVRAQVERHIQAGFIQIDEEEDEGAHAEFEKALALDSGDREALAGLALAHVEAHRPEAALAVFDRHADRVAADAGLTRVRVHVLKKAGRAPDLPVPGTPIPELTTASDFFLASYVALREAAASEITKLDEALAHSVRAVHIAPSPRLLYYSQCANAANAAKDARVARECADVLVTLWPDDPEAWSARAAALYDDHDRQLAALRRLLELRVAPATLTQLGGTLSRQGRQDEAVRVLEEATRLGPDYHAAWCVLGRLFESRRELPRSIAALDRAIAIDATCRKSWIAWARVRYRQGEWELAAEGFRKAIAIRPFAAEWTFLGAALSRLGKHDEALAAHRNAVALDPRDAQAWNNIGNSLASLGRSDEAVTAYQKSLEINPDHAQTWGNLGELHRKQNRLDDAVTAFRRSVAIDPKNHGGWRVLARLEASLGEFEAAAKSAGEAVRTDPDSDAAQEALAALEPVAATSARLRRILAGDEPARVEPEVRDQMLTICRSRKAWHDEAHLWRRIFAEGPGLETDLDDAHRRGAARAAIKAGTGQGGVGLDEAERSGWRKQALAWLVAERAAWVTAQRYGDLSIEQLRHAMITLQDDRELAPVRGAEIEKLPEAERAAWKEFWKSVAELAGP